jgi:DNA-binding Lrp family transcriptional regulator
MSMDEVDQKIIELLTKDARISFRKIAKIVKKSPDTIINRYKSLRDLGHIRGSTVIVNPRLIGYEGMAAFHIDVSTSGDAKPDPSKILTTLIKMQNIIVATRTVGDHDLLAIGVIHNFTHLMSVGKEISAIPGIKRIEMALWSNTNEVCHKYFIV